MDRVVPSDCNTFVFAPHGHLSLLPLHALYDNSKGNHLIQQTRVCYTPSLRTLSHCFELQQTHKLLRRFKPLERAFVAGNPHPMGCDKQPLPGAENEAKKVAEILDVQPCVQGQMTNEAVKQGLCGISIVLLATDAHPGETIASRQRERKSEGVLGLGRSVLQAGASIGVLLLWKVHDETTSDLVAGVFQNARDGPSTVVKSLRISILNMSKVKNIYHWGPFNCCGFPTLCMMELIAEIEEEMVDTINPFSDFGTECH